MTNSAVTRAGAPCWHHCYLKTTEVKGHFKCFDNPSKKGRFKRLHNHQMFSGVFSCTDTRAPSWTVAIKLETAICLFSDAAGRSISGLKVIVLLCVLVLVHERKPKNILGLSCLLNLPFFDGCRTLYMIANILILRLNVQKNKKFSLNGWVKKCN